MLVRRRGHPEIHREDLKKIEASVDGSVRTSAHRELPHRQGNCGDKQEAFDRYLVRCDVPKYPLSLAEASELIRRPGEYWFTPIPNDPNGTSLASITRDLRQQTQVIENICYNTSMASSAGTQDMTLEPRRTISSLPEEHDMFMTGGSDCHQKPLLMGTLGHT
jgi:3',5'-nucleoside bisphosphate phosphatase